MPVRKLDEIHAGLEQASPEQPFMLSKAELIAHIESNDSTGCGGYSSVDDTNGRRDVAWDYACRD